MLNKLIIKPFSHYCSLEEFNVNDVEDSNWWDFGYTYDACPSKAPEYGCGNKCFHANKHTEEILNKYSITETEYYEICKKLEEALHFGCCAECA